MAWFEQSWLRKRKMSKEQESNREKKKPKQNKSATPAASGTAYAQAFKTKGSKK
jgi:hypothetical protein